jgi:tripartite-type tricarboxylate transporter receptor subunit TctC
MKSLTWRMLILPCFLIFLAAAAQAAEKPFYQGKKLVFLINFSAGGPTDIEGRIVARHLARHIPGNPLIVVQNMSGAGGVTGINYLGEKAKPVLLTFG